MDIWIVWKKTGEYADKTEDMIGLFSSEKPAKKLLQSKRREYNKLGLNIDGDNSKSGDYSYCIEHSCDYTGCSFFISGPHEVKE